MNNYYSNINQINEDVESFVIAKKKIEDELIHDKKIEKKMSIKDFLNYIQLKNTFVYMEKENMKVIAFNIFTTKINEHVIMFSSVSDNAFNVFKTILENIKFDISNLKHYSQIDLLNGKLLGKNYFIINNEFYYYE